MACNLREQKPTPQITASKTGDAEASNGGVANAGVIYGGVHQVAGRPVRNDYIEQVRRIAPPSLGGRESELAQISEFCLAPKVPLPYMWWRADAWAGKTALMSWFVLHPPERVRIVSFFVTSGYPGQDNRVGFIDNVIEQLAALLPGMIMLPRMSAWTMDTHLMGMLSEAARACQAGGQRLVLVLDGLDEDQGVTADSVHSIAALLPDPPSADMRIIVTSRGNLSVPDDVPRHHRLRDPAVLRFLPVSPYATALQWEMKSALKQLLDGGPVEQDILGLVTASRGGLSISDLRELTDMPTWKLDDVLRTVTGRSFAARPSLWEPGVKPDVYLLAHSELQRTAADLLDVRLASYRQRVHDWADRYRELGWPENTPEYLLRGYSAMLRAVHDDQRLMNLAGEGARNDRMLAGSGGDGDGLADVKDALVAATTCVDLDLTVVARIAHQRDRIEERNAEIPANLPIAWARLRYHGKAESIARSIDSFIPRVRALTEIGVIYSENGLNSDACRILREVSEIVRDATYSNPPTRNAAWGILAEGLACSGYMERVEEILEEITEPYEKLRILARVAVGLARGGNDSRAESLAASVEDPGLRVETMADVAFALASSGSTHGAVRSAKEVEQLMNSTDSRVGYESIVSAAQALGLAGENSLAERLVRQFSDREARAFGLAELSRVLATSGDANAARLAAEAEALLPADSDETSLDELGAQLIDSSPSLFHHLTAMAIAQVHAAVGEVSVAEEFIRTISNPAEQIIGLIGIAETIAAMGDSQNAIRVLSNVDSKLNVSDDPEGIVDSMVAIALAATAAGNPGFAAQILEDAEAAVVRTPAFIKEDRSLSKIAEALAGAGEACRALQVAGAIRDAKTWDATRARIAAALAEHGKFIQGWETAADIGDPEWKAWALVEIVEALAKAPRPEEAAEFALKVPHAGARTLAFTRVAAAASLAGQRDLAQRMVDAIADQSERSNAQMVAAASFARAGWTDHALAFANSVPPDRRSEAMAHVVLALVETGYTEEALNLSRMVEDQSWRMAALAYIADSLSETDPPACIELLAEVDECMAVQNTQLREDASRFVGLDARISTYAASARAFARIGRVEQAVSHADKIAHPGTRRRALQTVAVLLNVAGERERAESLARGLPTPQRQAQALAAMAVASAGVGDPATAKRLLASALQIDSWTSSAIQLGEISMSALQSLADDIREELQRALRV